MKKILLVLAIAIMATSCVKKMVKNVGKKDPVNSQMAYVYGNFYHETSVNSHMMLRIQNLLTQKKGWIHLEKRGFSGAPERFQMYAVTPGKYRIDQVSLDYSSLGPKGKSAEAHANREFNHPVFSAVFDVIPGTCVYIGDFNGKSELSGSSISWGLEARKNFQDATKRLNELFPATASMNKVEAFK